MSVSKAVILVRVLDTSLATPSPFEPSSPFTRTKKKTFHFTFPIPPTLGLITSSSAAFFAFFAPRKDKQKQQQILPRPDSEREFCAFSSSIELLKGREEKPPERFSRLSRHAAGANCLSHRFKASDAVCLRLIIEFNGIRSALLNLGASRMCCCCYTSFNLAFILRESRVARFRVASEPNQRVFFFLRSVFLPFASAAFCTCGLEDELSWNSMFASERCRSGWCWRRSSPSHLPRQFPCASSSAPLCASLASSFTPQFYASLRLSRFVIKHFSWNEFRLRMIVTVASNGCRVLWVEKKFSSRIILICCSPERIELKINAKKIAALNASGRFSRRQSEFLVLTELCGFMYGNSN